jgi:signal transduction histidine kinase
MDEQMLIKVLLIENDSTNAELLRSLLQAEDSQIYLQWTDRLSSAIELLTKDTFTIVICDLDLPDSRGLKTFTKLHDTFPYTPIVVISEVNDQKIAIEAVQKGAQDYLIKGLAKGNSIVRLIRYSIERQRLITECNKHLKEIKTLKGLIPMCAWCRKVHNHRGYWEKVEKYIEEQTDASFTHGICPECLQKTDPAIFEQIKEKSPELFKSDSDKIQSGENRGIRVLLIEDDSTDVAVVRSLAKQVKGIQIDITHADRLSTAIEILERKEFDLILTDLGLPDSQGIGTFIKINTVRPNLPVVLLTGNNDTELASTAVRSGAQDYVVKGDVNSAMLLKSIQYAIERNKMVMDLKNNVREIRKLEREREKILSMFAHDVKNAIVPSTLLLSRILSNKPRIADSDVASVRDELITAEHLLADFIEFSRLRTKEYKPVLGPFNIEATVRKQFEVDKLKAGEKNIKMAFEFSEAPFPMLTADTAMIERVIANLLDNAVKYTPAGGSINIRVRNIGTNVLVQVQDTGIGITDDYMPHIFDAFYRVSGEEKGSGLGLSIAKTIVKAHGGDIWVESTSGKGSTFSFTLPRL